MKHAYSVLGILVIILGTLDAYKKGPFHWSPPRGVGIPKPGTKPTTDELPTWPEKYDKNTDKPSGDQYGQKSPYQTSPAPEKHKDKGRFGAHVHMPIWGLGLIIFFCIAVVVGALVCVRCWHVKKGKKVSQSTVNLRGIENPVYSTPPGPTGAALTTTLADIPPAYIEEEKSPLDQQFDYRAMYTASPPPAYHVVQGAEGGADDRGNEKKGQPAAANTVCADLSFPLPRHNRLPPIQGHPVVPRNVSRPSSAVQHLPRVEDN